MPARAPKIGDMCYRVALCTMNDVVLEGDAMTLSREVVTFTWASITHQWNQPSFIGKEGYAVKELRDRPTHLITVRYGLQLDYTSAAWVYEQRLKSPPRWYKVVGFAEQYHNWVMLHCHLVEKSDKATEPTGPLSPVKQDIVGL